MSDPAPKRRLPFKPTALRKSKSDAEAAKASGDGEDDDLALFRRSRHMMPLMTADAERRVKREKEKEEARKRSETAERRNGSEPGSAQKRRASECDGIEDEGGYSTPSRQLSSPGSSKRHHAESASPTKLTTPVRVKESGSPMPPLSRDDTIAILDDDDVVPIKSPQTESPVKSGMAHWAADSIRAHATGSTSALGDNPVEIIDDDDDDGDEIEQVPAPAEEETDPELQAFVDAARERQRLAESQESEAPAETIKVLVESTIPRTLISGKPLTFRLTSSGQLKDVKTTWCSVMEMNNVDVTAEDIFFTWRSRRLYNTTTLRGLGIATMGNDLLYAGDVGDRRGFSADRRKVVLQAWTEELFEAHLAEEEKEEKRRLGELDEEETGPGAPVEEKIKVAMRSRQGEPVKVTTTASSTIGDLVAKFREKRHLPSEVRVSIYFDGEKFEEGMTLQDADIGDDDQVEVHLD